MTRIPDITDIWGPHRPKISHVAPAAAPPLRKALARRHGLEGPTHHLIRAAGIGPALTSRKPRR